MVIWGGLYTVCRNLSEGPLSFVGWWSDPMLEQPFWSGQPLCALCVCQKCTVVSKEQLKDQLLHHLGSSEGDGRHFHWFGTWCDAFGQFLLSHSVSCQRRWEKVWGPARSLISHHFWWGRGSKGCHYVWFDLSGFRGTCLFQRPPQLTMSKALVRSLKATYRSMLCSQHFYFNWYSTKIVSTVLLLVRKLHWLMESVCSAIVGSAGPEAPWPDLASYGGESDASVTAAIGFVSFIHAEGGNDSISGVLWYLCTFNSPSRKWTT